jgi:hypothetical protein
VRKQSERLEILQGESNETPFYSGIKAEQQQTESTLCSVKPGTQRTMVKIVAAMRMHLSDLPMQRINCPVVQLLDWGIQHSIA